MKQYRLLSLLALCVACNITFAQDLIVTNDGKSVKAYNMEVSSESVFYQLEDRKEAPLQKLQKSDILIIKKADGSKLDFSDKPNESIVSKPQSQAVASDQPGIVQLKPEDLPAEARAANEALIANINAPVELGFDDKHKDEVGKKEAISGIACFGVSPKSLLCNEDIEILIETGQLYKASAKSPVKWRKESLFSMDKKWGGYYRGVINPAIQFTIKNKSAQTLYLDLANTFFVNMGQSCCFYVPSSTTTSKTSSGGAGVNLGAVTGALGIGGVAGTLANGVNVGGGSSNTTTSTTYSQRIIAVPPMSNVSLEPKYFFGNEFRNIYRGLMYDKAVMSYEYCIKVNFSPKFESGTMMFGDHYKYKEENSPVQFSFFLAYSKSENGNGTKVLSSFFYLKDLLGCAMKYSNMPSHENMPYFSVYVTNDSGASFPKK